MTATHSALAVNGCQCCISACTLPKSRSRFSYNCNAIKLLIRPMWVLNHESHWMLHTLGCSRKLWNVDPHSSCFINDSITDYNESKTCWIISAKATPKAQQARVGKDINYKPPKESERNLWRRKFKRISSLSSELCCEDIRLNMQHHISPSHSINVIWNKPCSDQGMFALSYSHMELHSRT
jgi:hypothetical protein